MKQLSKKFEFVGYPQEVDSDNYKKARQYIVEMVTEYRDDIVALYEYGVVGAPGLSDLDFIIVLDDKPKSKNLKKIILLEQAPKYVFKTLDGSILRAMNETHFRKVKFLGDIHLHRLYGKDIVPSPIEASQQQLIKLADVMDWLPERILMLWTYASMEHIPIKRLVGCLHSLQHTIRRTFDVVDKKIDHMESFLTRLRSLRQNWFYRDKGENLDELSLLLQESITVGFELMNFVSSYLISKELYIPASSQSEIIFYINDQKGFRFSKNRGTLINNDGFLLIDVPWVWLTHLYFYSMENGMIGTLLKENIRSVNLIADTGKVNNEVLKILSIRMKLCNDMAVYLDQLNLYKSLYRFAHIKKMSAFPKR